MNVFETNSSSEHAFSYPEGTEPSLRDKSEFPLPDENGLLEIELDTYWKSGIPKCCTDDVKRIIQYFAAQSICSVKVDYVKDKHGKWESIVDKDVLVKNHTDFLEMLKIVYKEFGLPEIKDYRCYVLTVDGDKVIIDGYEKQDYRNCEFEPECMSRDEYYAMLARFHKDSDYPDCPKLAHYIGISANCLTEDSFIQAFEYLDPVDGRDDLYKKKHDMPLDILRKRITLTFWHS